ncbi:MAG: hypothetical protein QNJ47_25175 [Nostocaceae cyanobacterium]|nr:hypothetical protein [Nostocaceae cyanobacterium]
MNNQEYSVNIGQYFSRGWEIFSQYSCGFIGFLIVIGLISGITSQLPAPLGTGGGEKGGLVNFIISPILFAGIYIVALQIAKNKPKKFSDFFRGFNKFIQIFNVNALSSVLIGIGSLFLVIPGIYLAVAYMFSVLFVIDKKLNAWSALSASRKVITKNWFDFFGLGILLILLNLAGALILVVGLFVTIPWTYCIIVAAFEDIVGLNGSISQ